ncbi:HAD family hydrolase [Vibrio porteresiae]|uniref:HAD family phosphatase n=1 Tax=Vibrio porteresiae DSM 19223 TaxID=1123496 RepID=A0ABZ0QHB7_9VIBR|nr:HAD family phosphatase [Vibrio porteresiae]WPC75829.1 HAD family phosphatase [Vibrio porteresiae DSM 19223]
MKKYQAYLFDMDGTLVNSEPLKGQALALACKEYGADVDYHIYQSVMGEDWATVTQHFFDYADITPDFDQFNAHFRRHYERLLEEQLSLNSGAREYLAQLNQQGFPCAVVSSAANWMVDKILKQLDLASQFKVVIGREDVTKHKPDPQAYLLALERLGVKAQQAVIFEDSEAGLKAGLAADCDVIAIAHEFNQRHHFEHATEHVADFRLLLQK